jgi:hypothetical protein
MLLYVSKFFFLSTFFVVYFHFFYLKSVWVYIYIYIYIHTHTHTYSILLTYVCMCVYTYVCMCCFCYWPPCCRFSISIKNKVVNFNFYIQIVYMFWCCHIISGTFARDSSKTHKHYQKRKFLLTGLFPTFFVREQPCLHVHMHDMLYQ